jgi:hypothetical protein
VTRKLFAVFQIAIPIALCASLFLLPRTTLATTCGTGSNITFTDIGGGRCRGYLTTTGAGTWTVPRNQNSYNKSIEAIGGGA